MVDCQLFKLRPAGHHLMSLAIHAANAILLFLVLLRHDGRRVAERGGGGAVRRSPAARRVGGLGGGAQGRTEHVFWAGGAVGVASLRRSSRACSAIWLLSLLFAASLMSKPMLVTLPCLLLLLDWWPLRRVGGGDRAGFAALLMEKLPLVLMAAASCGMTLYAQSEGHAVVPLGRLPIAARLATIAQAYCGYLQKMFVPAGLRRSIPCRLRRTMRPRLPAASRSLRSRLSC